MHVIPSDTPDPIQESRDALYLAAMNAQNVLAALQRRHDNPEQHMPPGTFEAMLRLTEAMLFYGQHNAVPHEQLRQQFTDLGAKHQQPAFAGGA